MKKFLALLPLTASALALAACASSPAPAPPAPADAAAAVMADPPEESVECGTVTGTGNAQAKVTVRHGEVDCAAAATLMTRYFAKLTKTDLSRADGAGPVALDPWTCGSDAGTPLSATCSTEDGREVVARPS
ncbi:hypothetical protein FPZ12_039160 [Amycolatopsis acidicola]|uniref:Uncharacterized protein n=1 Tax=Amycolatopsis acidicola TaxID=2596893 RepID=A0A5N0UP62_9PSEU|nr:hypothetical protein [Amycolatopsis acidicola]KAA9151346.1 hypothetical protein FPZ12_039160 [Amycolatopsis acidicola]